MNSDAYKELTASARLVWQCLLSHYKRNDPDNEHHEVRLSVSVIENETDFSHATVINSLHELRGYRKSKRLHPDGRPVKDANGKFLWQWEQFKKKSDVFITLPAENRGGILGTTNTYRLSPRYIF